VDALDSDLYAAMIRFMEREAREIQKQAAKARRR
jgi:hypothetical protein